EGTRLGAMLGASELRVNSFHHQAVNRLGRELRDVAWAPDNVIGAVGHADRRRYILGGQWHPQEPVRHDRAARALFSPVGEAARGRVGRARWSGALTVFGRGRGGAGPREKLTRSTEKLPAPR